jgi:hypothetical protein
MQHAQLTRTKRVPKRYLPKQLSPENIKRQRKYLLRSRKEYKQKKYYLRPTLKTFKSKKSPHVHKAMKVFQVTSMKPSRALAKKTGCTLKALNKIVNKGRGAYYSSGSRPNQTPDSWGIARLSSSLTGGPAARVDRGILEEGCEKGGKVLRALKKSLKQG